MTKDELIQAITSKVAKANPVVQKVFLRGLKYKRKEELKDLLQRIEVSEDGYDIETL